MARLIAAVALAVAPAALPAAAAPAPLPHPQGLPGIVRVTTDFEVVRAEWVLAPDDEAALAERFTDVGEYFRQHFRVASDGVPCEFLRYETHHVEAALAVALACARPPAALEFRSTLLLDLDRAYRTLLTVETELAGGRVERRFLGAEHTTATVGIRRDIKRAEDVADQPAEGLPLLERRVVRLLDGPLSLGGLLAGLAGAVVVGAVHALSPGHGKSVAAAYLVGSRGRPVHALALGGVVAAMHCGSVLALGLATWFATETVEPGRVMDGLRLVMALAVLGIGAYLVVTRTRQRRLPGHAHAHGHAHPHTHPDHHSGHRATPADGTDGAENGERAAVAEAGGARPFSRRGVVALGLSGGLLPSPAALVVVLAGLSAGRLGLALALVGAFSLGLAGAVAAAGLVVLKGRDLVEVRAANWLPLAAAYAILGAGLVLTVTALR